MDNHLVTSGTPGYQAPEVMLNRNHGPPCDFFALGVIAFECITGKRPYRGKEREQIRDKMLAKQEEIVITDSCPYNDYPQEAADFVNKLILKNPEQRLASLDQVRSHPWFENFDWTGLEEMAIEPIYRPEKSTDNFDVENIKKVFSDGDDLKEFEIALKRQEAHEVFSKYFYDKQK